MRRVGVRHRARVLAVPGLTLAMFWLGASASGQSGSALDVVAVVSFTEGPAVAPDGSLFFTDLVSQRIMRVDPHGALSTYREDSNNANGLMFDSQGRLVACEGGRVERPGVQRSGRPRVTRTDLSTGRVEVLAESGNGLALVGPNDVSQDSRGTIYFTDLAGQGVYRIAESGRVTQLLNAKTVNRPNGIQISPDDTMMYIVETGGSGEPRRLVRAYRIRPDGSLERDRIHHAFYTADGMSIDVQGNLYVSGRKEPSFTGGPWRSGVFVVAPDGSERGFYPVPVDFTPNNAFGGADMKTLFIVGGHTVFRVRTDVAGLPR